MKFKKILIAFILASGLGISLNQPQTTAAMTKHQVITNIKKDIKTIHSGQLKQNIVAHYSGLNEAITSTAAFTNRPLLIHVNNQTLYNNKTTQTDEWLEPATKRLYTRSNNQWYYKKLPANYQTAANSLSSKAISKPLQQFINQSSKTAKLKKHGKTYTLSANIADKKWFIKTISNLLTTKLNKTQLKDVKKHLKFKKIHVVLTVKGKKLIAAKAKVNLTYAKVLKATINENLSQIGNFNNLTLPSAVKNAAKLPAN
ncbi:hypothetical protein OZY43_07385 [Lactobacillus sp. ESL0785]|uniref:DUF6612 family protein n=1 Tax=Lactobacillus sp. ESL0785 TaxID=2983232 RepID=UPI0023F905D8|nr:DUF6612 family protein [Lactobacillus sp. ESL0785]WEV70749.1 hypothetical protein OZY43_07385 [Lactobacillus sp. ESL0785]